MEHKSAGGGKGQAVGLTLAGKHWELQHEIGGKNVRPGCQPSCFA